ncbi:T9SS type A sorting domain-containing protein [Wenyingzhuangia sp. IMCC45574]
MKKITLLLAFLASILTNAQTVLSAGDVAIIGIQTDTPDSFSFILLRDIVTNTVINFTENGWLPDSEEFRSNGEGTIEFTASQNYSAGKLFTYTEGGSNITDFNSVKSLGLSASGDQVIIYQGTAESPTFIFAAQTNSTLWQNETDADDSNTSGLPKGLIDGTNAVAAGAGTGIEAEYDNIYYNGITSGTKEELLAAIANVSNWVGINSSGDYASGVDTSDFSVTGSLSIKNDRIPGLITTAKEGKITTNKGAIKAIYNITGQEVKNEDLVSGVYIVHVTEGANNEIQKVVVK